VESSGGAALLVLVGVLVVLVLVIFASEINLGSEAASGKGIAALPATSANTEATSASAGAD